MPMRLLCSVVRRAVWSLHIHRQSLSPCRMDRKCFLIYSENDIETYRDVLFYIGQVLGGFFCINREGNWNSASTGMNRLWTSAISRDFQAAFLILLPDTQRSVPPIWRLRPEYYALETDDGLTMNLGVNPFLQFGVDETRKELCEQILADISVIKYVPFDSETPKFFKRCQVFTVI